MIIPVGTPTALGVNEVKSILLTSAAAASTLVITDANSNVVLAVACPANDTRFVAKNSALPDRFPIPANCSATLTGTGAFARVE